jgi:hypothetical protein
MGEFLLRASEFTSAVAVKLIARFIPHRVVFIFQAACGRTAQIQVE